MKIKRAELKQILRHCEQEYPYEACGILAGKGGVVEKVYLMENVSETPQTCYFMKPEEQLKVFKEMRSLNLEMLAIYHSHINFPAYPSRRDLELAFYPDVSYLIISLGKESVLEIKSFKISDQEIIEEELELLED